MRRESCERHDASCPITPPRAWFTRIVRVRVLVGVATPARAQAERGRVLRPGNLHVQRGGALARAQRQDRRVLATREVEQRIQRERRRVHGEVRRQLDVARLRDAELLEQAELLDLDVVAGGEQRDLRLAERHLGATDVERGAQTDRELRLRQLELRLGRLHERVLKRGARLRLQHAEVLLRHRRAELLARSADVRVDGIAIRHGGLRVHERRGVHAVVEVQPIARLHRVRAVAERQAVEHLLAALLIAACRSWRRRSGASRRARSAPRRRRCGGSWPARGRPDCSGGRALIASSSVSREPEGERVAVFCA